MGAGLQRWWWSGVDRVNAELDAEQSACRVPNSNPVALRFDVPTMVFRGYISVDFVHDHRVSSACSRCRWRFDAPDLSERTAAEALDEHWRSVHCV